MTKYFTDHNDGMIYKVQDEDVFSLNAKHQWRPSCFTLHDMQVVFNTIFEDITEQQYLNNHTDTKYRIHDGFVEVWGNSEQWVDSTYADTDIFRLLGELFIPLEPQYFFNNFGESYYRVTGDLCEVLNNRGVWQNSMYTVEEVRHLSEQFTPCEAPAETKGVPVKELAEQVVPQQAFKVGDLVKYVGDAHTPFGNRAPVGLIGTIQRHDDCDGTWLVRFNDFTGGHTFEGGSGWYCYEDSIELLKGMAPAGLCSNTPVTAEDIRKAVESIGDTVNHPDHYTAGGMEVIDILQAKLTPEQFKGFLIGNVLKYTFRFDKKNGTEDIKKAQWYLAKLQATQEGGDR